MPSYIDPEPNDTPITIETGDYTMRETVCADLDVQVQDLGQYVEPDETITIEQFIETRRDEIDLCIRERVRAYKIITDKTRINCIHKDPGLRLWAQSVGVEL